MSDLTDDEGPDACPCDSEHCELRDERAAWELAYNRHGPSLAAALATARAQGAAEIAMLRAEVERLREALSWFLTDERFQVAVGGNPNVVERMLDQARAALSSEPQAAADA